MRRQGTDSGGRRRRPGRVLPALVLLLVMGLGALAGGPGALPSPALQTASTTNPVPPGNVRTTAASGALVVSWDAVTETGLTGYRVYFNGTLRATVSGAATTTTVSGLVNGQQYSHITVRTTTQQFIFPYEGVDSVATSGTPHNGLPPATPAGFTATRGDRQVVLGWTASSDLEIRSYEVRRDGALIATLPASATGYTDTGRTNGVSSTYALVAVDVAGMRSTGATTSATPKDTVAPAAPTGLAATPGDGSVALIWTANLEYDIASYRVLRNGAPVATVSGTSYTDTGRTNGTAYAYSIQAVDTSDNVSPASSPAVTATPHDGLPPVMPDGLAVTPGDSQVTLSWTATSDPEVRSYEVRRDGVLIATPTSAATSYTDSGLTNGVLRTYTLVAVDVAGMRSPAATASATPMDAVAPAAPSGLIAMPGDEQIALSWTPNAEADIADYLVYRDGVQVAVVSGISWVDTGLVNGVEHEYRLIARDTSGNESPLSALAVRATAHDGLPPEAPADLAATPSDRQVVLTWTASADPEVRGYQLRRDGVLVASLAPGVTTWSDTGLVNGVAYAYELVAVDVAADVSAPAAVSATPRDAVDPAPPTGLVAVAGDSQVVLTWEDVSEYDIGFYRVLRDGIEVAVVIGTTWTDTGVVNGTTYEYTVVAVDTSGNDSGPSDPASALPRDAGPPAAPTGLSAAPGDREVTLTWDANPESDVVGYRVWRDGVQVAMVAGTTWTDSGLTNAATYTYVLIAVDSSGNDSPPSDPVSATPVDGGPPAAPAGLVALPGDGEVTLLWDAVGEYDVTGYLVFQDGAQIADLTGTTWTGTGLTNGQEYTFTVVAVDSSGNGSDPSDPASATPRPPGPAAPTGVTASPGDERAVVRWTAAPEIDVVAYRVLADDGSVVVEVAAPATSATPRGLVNGTTYRLTVVAVDADGNVSDPSDEVEVVPVFAPVAIPTEGSGQSGGLAASSDGRFVVVGTRARLEPSDTNTAYELYLVDRDLGTERRIAPLGATATGTTDPTNASAPAVSDDGRYVALATTAKLLPADVNTLSDVYRFDAQSRTWMLVSVPASGAVHKTVAGTAVQTGASVYAKSPAVALSGTGDVALFYSARADLVPGDTNAKVDLFAKTLSTGAVARVSTTATGTNLPRVPTGPALALTPDGRYALFPAVAGSGPAVLYRKTLSGPGAGAITVVSAVTVAGRATEFGVFRDAGDIAISDDGRYVALVTTAKVTTTTPTAAWAAGLAYRKDLDSGAIVPVGSGQRTVWEHAVELDPTGRFAFFSTASPALAGDTNGHTDFFRRDLDGGVAGPLVLVTGNAAGSHTTGPIGSVAATEFGRLIASSADEVLVTTSQALAPVDGNRLRDLYAKDLDGGAVRTPLA